MKVTLTFEKGDFENLRAFEKAVEKQCGKTYVSGTYLCWYFDLPLAVQTLLSPMQRGGESHQQLMAQLEKDGTLSFDVESSKEVSKL